MDWDAGRCSVTCVQGREDQAKRLAAVLSDTEACSQSPGPLRSLCCRQPDAQGVDLIHVVYEAVCGQSLLHAA